MMMDVLGWKLEDMGDCQECLFGADGYPKLSHIRLQTRNPHHLVDSHNTVLSHTTNMRAYDKMGLKAAHHHNETVSRCCVWGLGETIHKYLVKN